MLCSVLRARDNGAVPLPEGVLRTVAVARACVSQLAMDSFWQVTGAWWQGVVCATVTLPRHWCRLRAVGVLQTEQARAP